MQSSSIDAINAEISRLISERSRLMIEREAFAVNLREMNKRGRMIADILYKASTIQDPSMTLLYVKAFLLPWRHYVLRAYFPNLLEMLPRDLPAPSWTRADASDFLLSVSRALEKDRLVILSRCGS